MKIKNNQDGIAHVLVIALIAIAVVGAGGFAYVRIKNAAQKKSNSITADDSVKSTETLPQNLSGLKTLDEIKQIAGVTDTVTLLKFSLETKDGGYVYKITLSDGRVLVINASSGAILSQEKSDLNKQKTSSAKITITPAQAYQIAAGKSSSPIKSIELETEDNKVTYKIEYKDGSKIEIDATSGAIVKSEIKTQTSSSSLKSENQNDDQNEQEDHTENKTQEPKESSETER